MSKNIVYKLLEGMILSKSLWKSFISKPLKICSFLYYLTNVPMFQKRKVREDIILYATIHSHYKHQIYLLLFQCCLLKSNISVNPISINWGSNWGAGQNCSISDEIIRPGRNSIFTCVLSRWSWKSELVWLQYEEENKT